MSPFRNFNFLCSPLFVGQWWSEKIFFYEVPIFLEDFLFYENGTCRGVVFFLRNELWFFGLFMGKIRKKWMNYWFFWLSENWNWGIDKQLFMIRRDGFPVYVIWWWDNGAWKILCGGDKILVLTLNWIGF